jgi:hypothetical protein
VQRNATRADVNRDITVEQRAYQLCHQHYDDRSTQLGNILEPEADIQQRTKLVHKNHGKSLVDHCVCSFFLERGRGSTDYDFKTNSQSSYLCEVEFEVIEKSTKKTKNKTVSGRQSAVNAKPRNRPERQRAHRRG